MSEQKEINNKNKIGARCLSDSEAELILPTYKRIYYQIDQFRMEKESVNRLKKQTVNRRDEYENNRNQDKDQKTNNIGIIGIRGAGKTSVLKTIRFQLEMNKHNKASKLHDIILPIIVPENMSESGTLMATILGMLSEVITERDEEEQKRKKGCNTDCIRKTSLRMKYDEVLKQYTYIQKEYRDILIRQYTTENDYVNRSAKVFNSDTEFINKFNELIDELVNTGEQNGSSSLLFLFIDDIDLSTYRCGDVVKTLLSYLSNENIVTFISGDLETFEEALTLDFLRQENVLNQNILNEKVGNNTLLDSKKLLAYEYLKKIIPPAYRYHIKYWSLEEMGNYCIEDYAENEMEEKRHTEGQEGKGNKEKITLSDLLLQALDRWVDPAFFGYEEIRDTESDDKENRDQKKNDGNNESVQITRRVLPYTYHLFDHTSRGLNNIYTVLSEIVTVRKAQKEDYSKEKKLLIDTIISSKPIYSKYRDDILKNYFYVGSTKADNQVFFDNARNVIYHKRMQEESVYDSNNLAKYQEMYSISNPVERFSLFILVDFVARLLYEADYEKEVRADASYKALKDEAMKDLFFHPVIAEKIMDVSNYSWESKDETVSENDTSKDKTSKKEEKKFLALKDMDLKDVNSSFLLKGDLLLNLAYYKNLPLDEMLKLYEVKSSEESVREMFVTAELEQSTIIAIWRAFSSMAGVHTEGDVSKIIARYYPVFWKEFAYIRNRMSSSVTQNIAMRLFDDEINYVLERNKKQTAPSDIDILQAERRKKTRMRRILSNTLARILKAKNDDAIQSEWQEIPLDKQSVIVFVNKQFEEIGKANINRKDVERQVQIIKVIDSERLWQEEAAVEVVNYLKETVKAYLRFLIGKISKENAWRLNTSAANDSWNEFEKTYVGESMTIAKRTRESVQEFLSENQTDFQQGMSVEVYGKVIDKLEDLAGNNRVWYGQSEAQQILNELQKASAEPKRDNENEDIWASDHSYFKFLLQCLYKYKLEVTDNRSIVKNASLLANITKELSIAHKEADRQTLEDFIVELNKRLDENIDSKTYEQLFSYKLKDTQRWRNDE